MEPRRAVIYARYSSDNQRDESIDAQIRSIEDYAERNRIVITKVYADKAKSATTDKRPQFQQMIKDSGLDLFDMVIVHKLDRFSRDKYDSAVYKMKLKRNGIRLISVTENLDGSPESLILESVIEGMAQYYSANLAREVMKGMKETAYQCRHTGGKPPLGYDVTEDKRYIINENEAEVVRKIFDMYISGYSYRKIIKALNDAGHRTKTGKRFGNNSLYGILDNEKYSGVYVFNKSSKKDEFGKRNSHLYKDEMEVIKIDGGMPAIITADMFKKAKKMMDIRRRAPGSNKAKESYLLSGLIVCGHCGGVMHGNRRTPRNKATYSSYRCSCRQKDKSCDNKEIRKEYIEEYVLVELEKKILNEKAITYLVTRINEYMAKRNSDASGQEERIRDELKQVDSQMANIVDAITNGFFQQGFKDKMNELEDRKVKLETRLKEIEAVNSQIIVSESMLRNMLSQFRTFVLERNLAECKKFIHDYVHKVIIYKDHAEVIFSVVLNFISANHDVQIKSSSTRVALIKKYSKSFYIKVDGRNPKIV